MVEERELCELKMKVTRKICGLHLMYIVIICAIIILVNILVVPNKISDVAFQNFSFASTVVSIVLAVVSIIYSLWSGKSSNSQYDSIRHIEKQIDNQLDNFTKIEQSIVANIGPIKEQVERIKDDQTKTNTKIDNFMSMYDVKNQPKANNSGKFDNGNNTTWGALTLYACMKAFDTKKPIPEDLMEKFTKSYWSGFLVAISKVMPDKMAYEYSRKQVFIKKFEKSFWGTENEIKKRLGDSEKEMIEQINHYFDDNSSCQ